MKTLRLRVRRKQVTRMICELSDILSYVFTGAVRVDTGATEILSGVQFVEQLEELGQKMGA